jgi:hypothetical protein
MQWVTSFVSFVESYHNVNIENRFAVFPSLPPQKERRNFDELCERHFQRRDQN